MEPNTIQEVGDVVCKSLILGGGLLMITIVGGWVLYFIKSNPRKDIQIRWKIKSP